MEAGEMTVPQPNGNGLERTYAPKPKHRMRERIKELSRRLKEAKRERDEALDERDDALAQRDQVVALNARLIAQLTGGRR